MSSTTAKTLSIKISAVDEASGIFHKVGQNLRLIDRQARSSGLTDVGRIARGAGAFAAVEIGARAIKAAADEYQEALQQLELGTISASQAVGEILQKSIDTVPILGSLVGAFRSMEDAGWDTAAAIAKWAGGSQSFVDSLKSSTTLIAEATAEAKAFADALDRATKAGRAVGEIGLTGDALILQKAQDEHDAMERTIQKLQDGLSKIPEGARFEEQRAIDAERRLNEAKLDQAKADVLRGLDIFTLQAQSKIDQIGAAASAHYLAASGRSLEAQFKEIEARRAAAHAQINLEEDEDLRQHPEERDQIEGQRRLRHDYADLDADAAGFDAKKKSDREREDQTRESEQRISQIEADEAERRLTERGKLLGARLVQLKESYDAEIKLIDVESKRAAEDDKPNGAEILDRASDQKAAIGLKYRGDVEQAKHDLPEEEADRTAEVDRTIAQQRIDELNEEGVAGNELAGIEAKRLEIAQQFNDRKRELLKITEDLAASAEERQAAAAALARLPGDQMKAEKDAYNERRAEEQRELLADTMRGVPQGDASHYHGADLQSLRYAGRLPANEPVTDGSASDAGPKKPGSGDSASVPKDVASIADFIERFVAPYGSQLANFLVSLGGTKRNLLS